MSDTNRIKPVKKELKKLSRTLGLLENRLVLLSEGNTSARIDDNTILVKASGSFLQDIEDHQLIQVRLDGVTPILDQKLDDQKIEKALMAARVDTDSLKPSVETLFHAWLQTRPGINYVAHTHPVEVNKILCSEKAAQFAGQRMFPDQIVCCGTKSLLVEYTDPGLELAKAIRNGWEEFERENGFQPKIVLVKNHGMIAVGPTPQSILAATFMAAKAAEIFNGAVICGGPVFMTPQQVERITRRKDEHYRQKSLSDKT